MDLPYFWNGRCGWESFSFWFHKQEHENNVVLIISIYPNTTEHPTKINRQWKDGFIGEWWPDQKNITGMWAGAQKHRSAFLFLFFSRRSGRRVAAPLGKQSQTQQLPSWPTAQRLLGFCSFSQTAIPRVGGIFPAREFFDCGLAYFSELDWPINNQK